MQIQTNNFEDLNKIMQTLAGEILKSRNGSLNIKIEFKADDNNMRLESAADNEIDIGKTITSMLRNLGIPAHILGYTYLKDAIGFCLENKEAIRSVTKLLYPIVAKKNNTTPSRVERAIRHSIEVALNRGDVEVINNLFGYTVGSGKGKPTNSEFIALLTDEIIMKSFA